MSAIKYPFLNETKMINYWFFCSIGYDKNCLKKAICELARHPLHSDNDDEHLLIEIINFIFTYVLQHKSNRNFEIHLNQNSKL